MIQRIQSLLLLLAAILLLAMFYFPIAKAPINGSDATLDLCYASYGEATILGNSHKISTYNSYAPYLNLGIVALLFVTIFSYKNRKRQILLSNSCFIINLAFLALTLMAPNEVLTMFGEEGHSAETIMLAGTFLPIASIAMIIMATRAIKSDEKLVKAADRLR